MSSVMARELATSSMGVPQSSPNPGHVKLLLAQAAAKWVSVSWFGQDSKPPSKVLDYLQRAVPFTLTVDEVDTILSDARKVSWGQWHVMDDERLMPCLQRGWQKEIGTEYGRSSPWSAEIQCRAAAMAWLDNNPSVARLLYDPTKFERQAKGTWYDFLWQGLGGVLYTTGGIAFLAYSVGIGGRGAQLIFTVPIGVSLTLLGGWILFYYRNVPSKRRKSLRIVHAYLQAFEKCEQGVPPLKVFGEDGAPLDRGHPAHRASTSWSKR